MSIASIYNVRQIDERLLLAGQPSEDQLRATAAEGFEVVINLSTNDPRYALPDEEGLVRSLGMQYHYLPVQWDNPTLADFDRYAEAMDAQSGRRMLVHCAANYRASAFHALYAMQRLGWSEAQADAFIASVWNPAEHPQWVALIAAVKGRIAAMP